MDSVESGTAQTGAIGLDEPAGTAAATWLRHLIVRNQPQSRHQLLRIGISAELQIRRVSFMRNWPYAWLNCKR